MFDWSFNNVAYCNNDFDGSSIKRLLAHMKCGLGQNGIVNIALNSRDILEK